MKQYPISPAVYRALRDESDGLCRHCKALGDDLMTEIVEDGSFVHSNGRECNASAIRRIWAVMLQAERGETD
jgi:hypothetical protein